MQLCKGKNAVPESMNLIISNNTWHKIINITNPRSNEKGIAEYM